MSIPEQLPGAIVRSRQLIEAVLAQSLLEMGDRAAPHWRGDGRYRHRRIPGHAVRAAGRPPTRAEILAEASAPPEGSTAPPGVPADYCDQLSEARHVLSLARRRHRRDPRR